MIGFKKPPIKLIVSVFLISFVAIFLIYIDLENNKPLPIEEMTFSEDLSEMPLSVENKRIHEVSKGESLSVIFEEKSVPLNTAYKIFNFDENDLLSSIIPGDKMQFSYIGDELISIEIIKDEINSILIKTKDEISIKKIEKKSQVIKSINKGVITNSFFKNASQIGIPDSIIMDFAYIFGWDVDFVFDVFMKLTIQKVKRFQVEILFLLNLLIRIIAILLSDFLMMFRVNNILMKMVIT